MSLLPSSTLFFEAMTLNVRAERMICEANGLTAAVVQTFRECALKLQAVLEVDPEHADAMLGLGNLSDLGIKGIVDHEGEAPSGTSRYQQAAKQGHVSGHYNLGLMHYNDHDMHQAKACWERAADMGHKGAMYNLGDMHRLGEGMPADPKEAERLFRKAAVPPEGNYMAMHTLGRMYCDGSGGGDAATLNKKKAMKWFRKAEAHGCPLAPRDIAILEHPGGHFGRGFSSVTAGQVPSSMQHMQNECKQQ
jgi:TPR repeat protein